MMVAKSLHHSSLYLLLAFDFKEGCSLLSTDVCMPVWAPGFLCNSVGYHLLTVIIGIFRWSPTQALAAPPSWPCVLWAHPHHSLSPSLHFGPKRCFRFICSVFASALESAISPRSPISFRWRALFRISARAPVCLCCLWELLLRPWQGTEVGKMLMVCRHDTHVCSCPPGPARNPELTPVPLIPVQQHRAPPHLMPVHVRAFLPQQEEARLPHSLSICLLLHPM